MNRVSSSEKTSASIRPARSPRGWLSPAAIVVGWMVVVSVVVAHARTAPVAAAGSPPNVVLLLADDMRWDMLWAMSTVQSELIDHGVTFSNGFVVNSWCCPSRATILTGKYSHGTGVWKQQAPNGGFEAFHDDSTIATWLHGAGYRTGFLGKYLNGYNTPSYVPPGWDRWFAFTNNNGQGHYYEYTVSSDGTPLAFGSAEQDYSVDVLAAQAASFIQQTPLGKPLFLEWAPIGPHQPAIPPSRHEGAFAGLPPQRLPDYNEADVSDKPLYLRNQKLDDDERAGLDQLRIDMYETLLAVDDGVATILDALAASGRLGNTLVLFASDNGLMLGEHRWDSKLVAYEESIRVPVVIRYDPLVVSPRVDARMVANIDFAPTLAGAAGLTAPGADGLSLLPLLTSPKGRVHADFLIEHLQGNDKVPTFCAVRGKRYKYVEYATGEEELYDVLIDPFEMTNRASDADMASILASMRARALQLCSPPPPGFTPRA